MWLLLFLLQCCGGLGGGFCTLPKRFAVISTCPVACVSDRVKPSSDASLHQLQRRRFFRFAGFRSPKIALFCKVLPRGMAGRSEGILLQSTCEALSSHTISLFNIRAPPTLSI